ncbi:MAG: CopD family protein [Anaerolineales bacterium]|nr:CopD family protein [Anaerolineales bacterium]
MKLHRAFGYLLLFVLLFSINIRPASAHAYLSSSTPEANAQLSESPVLIELIFSEPVEGNFSSIEVLDATGQRVDNDDDKVDDTNLTRMTVTVRSLPNGIFSVKWKALSLVDSHVTEGAFPFAVGDVDAAALDAAAAASQKFSLSFGEVIYRWLSYLAVSVLTGGGLFVLRVWQPVAQNNEEVTILSIPFIWRTLEAGALALLVVANLWGLLTQAGQVAGKPLVAPWNPAIETLLFNTKYGALWMARFVLILVNIRLLLNVKTNRDRWLALGATLLILVTFSLNSHAAAEARPFFPLLADWVHLLGAATWVGGLAFFIGALWATRGLDAPVRTRLTAQLIPRFSNLALVSVALIGLSGLYSAYLRVGSFDALTTTLYGRVLIVKTLLFLPMLMLGALNLLNTSPTMRRAAQNDGGNGSLVNRFRGLVSTEVIFAILLLLSVGLFTAVPPARAIGTDTKIRTTAKADDLTIQLEVDPGKIGINTFSVKLTANSEPVTGAKEVALQFTPTSADLPPSLIALDEVGEGVYRVQGAYLSMPDTWQIQVAVRREGQFDAFANFDFNVGATSNASGTFPWNRLNSFLLMVSAVLYLNALQRLQRAHSMRWLTVRGPALALLLAAGFVFYLPANTQEFKVNPIPPNPQSIAAGQAIYQIQCLSCHGPTGRGDGPVGLTLIPPPADLYRHTQPGIHPDGRLYDWITNGFGPDSAMPAFAQILTDKERWNVVNYIRTFSRTATPTSQP